MCITFIFVIVSTFLNPKISILKSCIHQNLGRGSGDEKQAKIERPFVFRITGFGNVQTGLCTHIPHSTEMVVSTFTITTMK